MRAETTVSVVIPVYHENGYLGRSLGSVIQQSQQGVEVIIVEDGLNDGCLRVIDEIRGRLPRDDLVIRYISQQHQGVSKARNRGIQEASGEYITFLDHDDVLPELSLERRVKFLDMNPEKQAVFANLAYYGRDGNKQFSHLIPEMDVPKLRRKFLFGLSPPLYALTSMCRTADLKSLNNGNPFDVELHQIEDQDFALRLLYGLKCGIIDEVVYNYHTDSHSLTTRLGRRIKAFPENLAFVMRNSEGLERLAALGLRVAMQTAKLGWEVFTPSKKGPSLFKKVSKD